METGVTSRGFSYYKFKDGYGAECSLHESSAARIEDEDGSVSDGFVWMGMSVDPRGRECGKEHLGDIVPDYMHLSQSTVRELLPLLQYFAEYGVLPQPEESSP